MAAQPATRTGGRWPPGDVQPKRCNRVVLAIGPTTAYLILAVGFLVVLGGGTWLAYYMERPRATEHAGAGPHRASCARSRAPGRERVRHTRPPRTSLTSTGHATAAAILGSNGDTSRSPPRTTIWLDSGTSRQAPRSPPSGSETTRRASSESSRSIGLSGCCSRSVATSVLTNNDRDRPSLE